MKPLGKRKDQVSSHFSTWDTFGRKDEFLLAFLFDIFILILAVHSLKILFAEIAGFLEG
jgi:hypothetical protein